MIESARELSHQESWRELWGPGASCEVLARAILPRKEVCDESGYGPIIAL